MTTVIIAALAMHSAAQTGNARGAQAAPSAGRSFSCAVSGPPCAPKPASAGDTSAPLTLPQAVALALDKNPLHQAALAVTRISLAPLPQNRRGLNTMPGWLLIIAFLIVYVVLTQWLLPRLGVPT